MAAESSFDIVGQVEKMEVRNAVQQTTKESAKNARKHDGSPAGQPTFQPWVRNVIGNIQGAAEALRARGLGTRAQIDAAVHDLESLTTRDDATALSHWNRACAVK